MGEWEKSGAGHICHLSQGPPCPSLLSSVELSAACNAIGTGDQLFPPALGTITKEPHSVDIWTPCVQAQKVTWLGRGRVQSSTSGHWVKSSSGCKPLLPQAACESITVLSCPVGRALPSVSPAGPSWVWAEGSAHGCAYGLENLSCLESAE